MNATPMKLQNGAWGISVPGRPEVGDAVTVTTRAGKTWNAVISRVIERSGSVSICATRVGMPEHTVRRAVTSTRRPGRRGTVESLAAGKPAPRVPYNGMCCPNCGSEHCDGRFAGQLCEFD